MPRLVLLKEGQATPHELTEYPVRLGRHPDCTIQLDSNMVSRFHAQLVQADDDVLLEDLGSGNGSFLNGKQLAAQTPTALKNGDRIKLGPVKFRFEDDSEGVRRAIKRDTGQEFAVKVYENERLKAKN